MNFHDNFKRGKIETESYAGKKTARCLNCKSWKIKPGKECIVVRRSFDGKLIGRFCTYACQKGYVDVVADRRVCVR